MQLKRLEFAIFSDHAYSQLIEKYVFILTQSSTENPLPPKTKEEISHDAKEVEVTATLVDSPDPEDSPQCGNHFEALAHPPLSPVHSMSRFQSF